MTKTATVSHEQGQQEPVALSGEALQHCTNKKNMASLPADP